MHLRRIFIKEKQQDLSNSRVADQNICIKIERSMFLFNILKHRIDFQNLQKKNHIDYAVSYRKNIDQLSFFARIAKSLAYPKAVKKYHRIFLCSGIPERRI